MLVELGLVEQRYKAVLEVLEGAASVTDTALPPGQPAAVPTAVSVFGGEVVPFPRPPRELYERYFEVAAWSVHDHGGHFPAVAEPQLLAEDLRSAFRPFRHTGRDSVRAR